MTYIILRDTFGNGLETISNIRLDMIKNHQLNEYICDAAEIVANEDGYESVSQYIKEDRICMGETLVICEIVEELKGKSVDTYILDVLKGQEEKQNSEDYQLYLKLKEKFEKWMCLETGFITNPGNLTRYQRARGIDTSKRKRIE